MRFYPQMVARRDTTHYLPSPAIPRVGRVIAYTQQLARVISVESKFPSVPRSTCACYREVENRADDIVMIMVSRTDNKALVYCRGAAAAGFAHTAAQPAC